MHDKPYVLVAPDATGLLCDVTRCATQDECNTYARSIGLSDFTIDYAPAMPPPTAPATHGATILNYPLPPAERLLHAAS